MMCACDLFNSAGNFATSWNQLTPHCGLGFRVVAGSHVPNNLQFGILNYYIFPALGNNIVDPETARFRSDHVGSMYICILYIYIYIYIHIYVHMCIYHGP